VALDVYYNQTYSVILQPSDYYLWPLDGPTYNEIRSAVGAAHCIYAGQFVEVIGQQGSGLSAVPAGVILANMILAIRFFKRNEAPFGVLAVPETGTVARLPWQDPDVEMLLGPYRHGTGIPVMVV
jgi:hypothetical protein